MSTGLKGSQCLVIGATGNIGRGAVKSFLKHGADKVIIVGRNSEKLVFLQDGYLEGNTHVVPVEADMTSPDNAQKGADKIKSITDKIDHLVSSSGPWWHTGSLATLDPHTWLSARASNVDAHFYAYRYLSGLVNKRGSFVIVNGAAAHALPSSGLTGLCAYTVEGLCKLLLKEGTESGLNIYELMISIRVADNPPMPGMKSEIFGEVFAAIASDSKKYKSGTSVSVDSEEMVKSMTI